MLCWYQNIDFAIAVLHYQGQYAFKSLYDKTLHNLLIQTN